jgi:lactate permease
MAIGQYLTATANLWNIAAFIGAIAGLVTAVIYTIQTKKSTGQSEKMDWRRLGIAFSGYIILVLIILTIQFVPGLKTFLSQIQIKVYFPITMTNTGYQTPAGSGRTIPIFAHAGAMLLYASLIGFFIFKRAGLFQPGVGKRILRDTVKKMTSSSISILSMVSLAVLMEHTGMTQELAKGLSSSFQSFFPLISPWIGAIGAFMTGSNTNSNVVFGLLQLQTALLLDLPVAIILAGQTAGAALASVIAPTKMVVGASTAGMSGKEGQVMRALIGYTLTLVVTISIFTYLGVLIASN